MTVITLPEVEAHLNISDSGNGDELYAFIESAEAAIARRVGPLGPVTQSERVRGGGRFLMLSHPPVISVTSVTSVEGAVTLPARLFVSSGGMVEFTQWGWFPSRFYDVVYQSGRATLPDDLRLAVLETVRQLWSSQRGNSPSMNGALPAAEAPLFGMQGGASSIVEQILSSHEPILGA